MELYNDSSRKQFWRHNAAIGGFSEHEFGPSSCSTMPATHLRCGIRHTIPGAAVSSNPIRIVVPSSPSTPPDIVSRIIASELAASEGWRVVVENRVGGSQSVGVGDVLKENPDGYSILAVSMPLTAIPAIMPKIGIRLDRDFVPVVQLSRSYNVLVVNPSLTVSRSAPSPARRSTARPAHAGYARSWKASCSTSCSSCPAWKA